MPRHDELIPRRSPTTQDVDAMMRELEADTVMPQIILYRGNVHHIMYDVWDEIEVLIHTNEY